EPRAAMNPRATKTRNAPSRATSTAGSIHLSPRSASLRTPPGPDEPSPPARRPGRALHQGGADRAAHVRIAERPEQTVHVEVDEGQQEVGGLEHVELAGARHQLLERE